MNTKHIIPLAAAFLLAAFSPSLVLAQEYVAPRVTISKEKVRSGGKVFYSHVVQERQTIYSISKAYGVTMEEIYDANPALKLETEGLKKDQILLIPYKGDIRDTAGPEIQPQEEAAEETVGDTRGEDDDDEGYFIHKVKWYEDLDAIAKKYKVSKESIMNINRMTSDKVKRKEEKRRQADIGKMSMLSKGLILAGLLLAAGAVLFAARASFERLLPHNTLNREVMMPDLIGLDPEESDKMLRDMGLRLPVTEKEYSTEIMKNKIVHVICLKV